MFKPKYSVFVGVKEENLKEDQQLLMEDQGRPINKEKEKCPRKRFLTFPCIYPERVGLMHQQFAQRLGML